MCRIFRMYAVHSYMHKELLGNETLLIAAPRAVSKTLALAINHVREPGCTQFPHESGCFSVIGKHLQQT
jgi:hypothetical protein